VSRRPQGWTEQRTLLTRDGVRISAAARLPAMDRSGDGATHAAYVLAHGFTGTWRSVGLT
jgi:hypothetical protein